MYEAHWRLARRPFENQTTAEFYYPGESHQGALLKLRYAVENARDAALLAGAAGLGKTLLLRTLLKQLPEEFSPRVHLVFPRMPEEQLLATLAEGLDGQTGEPAKDIHTSLRRIEQALARAAEEGRRPVVVIDEAHTLRQTGGLETLRLLLNLQVEERTALSLILCGQPSLLTALDRLPDLEQRLGVKCLLRPFHLEETVSYVRHRLAAAGAERGIFDDSALESLHLLSQGIPRPINRLGDLALHIGVAEERKSITSEQVEAVAGELVAIRAD